MITWFLGELWESECQTCPVFKWPRAVWLLNCQSFNICHPPPAISTVFPINRILYSISIGSILNRRSPVFYKSFQAFEKYTPFNSHAKVHSISLSLISIEVWITGKQFNATSRILKQSLNNRLDI